MGDSQKKPANMRWSSKISSLIMNLLKTWKETGLRRNALTNKSICGTQSNWIEPQSPFQSATPCCCPSPGRRARQLIRRPASFLRKKKSLTHHIVPHFSRLPAKYRTPFWWGYLRFNHRVFTARLWDWVEGCLTQLGGLSTPDRFLLIRQGPPLSGCGKVNRHRLLPRLGMD